MKCTLCPLACGADRSKTAGRCGVKGLTVAKAYLHPYEEPLLCHTNGAGAVFFGGCSLRCVFCQNYEVSRARRGRAVTPAELAEILSVLEGQGADCIDLVTGDHVADLIAEALSLYRPKVPVVFNTGGYCKVETLRMLDPFVDVWLPDLKFRDPMLSERYTGRRDYFEFASEAVRFMAKKPVSIENGRMRTGILVRHLILPACVYDSLQTLDFLKEVLPENAPVSLMRQYTPMGDISKFPELNRRLTAREYRRVVDYAFSLGFTNLIAQGKESASEIYVPDWD